MNGNEVGSGPSISILSLLNSMNVVRSGTFAVLICELGAFILRNGVLMRVFRRNGAGKKVLGQVRNGFQLSLESYRIE